MSGPAHRTAPDAPFVGLRPFESHESVLFFGREEQTVALLQQLHRHSFVAVVGSSGSGKSSLVRAGLIPKLEGGFLAGDRDRWHVALMKPGQNPLANLESAIESVTGEAPEALADAGTRGVLDVVEPLLAAGDANLLLVVDQFEELFRFGAGLTDGPEHERAAEFVKILLDLASLRELPIYLVMTMRSDFLGDCDVFAGLPEAFNRSQYLVPRLSRQQLRSAIAGPIRLLGAAISESLISRVLNDAGTERDSLPVVQHALMRTWQMWRGDGQGEIDHRHYEAAGTVDQALSEHAEEALDRMTDRERSLTELVFRALTDVDDSNRRIRRPARLSVLEAVTAAGREEILEVVERFRSSGRSFLVLSDDRDDPLIDISHESLIRQWRTLWQWVDTEIEAGGTYRRLADSALRHRLGEGAVLPERDLEVALEWWHKSTPGEAWAERFGGGFAETRKFLDKSRRQHEQKQEEDRRRERELEQVRERERRARKRIILLVWLAMFLIPLLGGWLAWRQGQQLTTAALLERLQHSKPEQAFADLRRLVIERRADIDEITARLRQRENLETFFERGLSDIEESNRGASVVSAVEAALPILGDRPEDRSKLLATILWALDRFSLRGEAPVEAAKSLRAQALDTLRAAGKPSPEPALDIHTWVEIPQGRFVMGSLDDDEAGHEEERPAHVVEMTAFEMLAHEVTNGEYRRLAPDHEGRWDLPAVHVNWYEAYVYCGWLGGRLPTEAEWEYAARAGSRTRFWNGDFEEELVRVGWYSRNPSIGSDRLRPVAKLDANRWGLYDVHGNAAEWVADWYGRYSDVPRINPGGPAGPQELDVARVLRGGAFDAGPWDLRSAFRDWVQPELSDQYMGFRCAR